MQSKVTQPGQPPGRAATPEGKRASQQATGCATAQRNRRAFIKTRAQQASQPAVADQCAERVQWASQARPAPCHAPLLREKHRHKGGGTEETTTTPKDAEDPTRPQRRQPRDTPRPKTPNENRPPAPKTPGAEASDPSATEAPTAKTKPTSPAPKAPKLELTIGGSQDHSRRRVRGRVMTFQMQLAFGMS